MIDDNLYNPPAYLTTISIALPSAPTWCIIIAYLGSITRNRMFVFLLLSMALKDSLVYMCVTGVWWSRQLRNVMPFNAR
ncbi:hypothetical protein EDB19DRAFT_1757302, partial [Suillus lakei]